jgi:hypothetical protein
MKPRISNMKMFLVEVIRYGDTKLGVHPFNFYKTKQEIFDRMPDYNMYRGGKYPSFYVSECIITEVSIGDVYDFKGSRYSGKVKFKDLWAKSMCRDKDLLAQYEKSFVVFLEVQKTRYDIIERRCVQKVNYRCPYQKKFGF